MSMNRNMHMCRWHIRGFSGYGIFMFLIMLVLGVLHGSGAGSTPGLLRLRCCEGGCPVGGLESVEVPGVRERSATPSRKRRGSAMRNQQQQDLERDGENETKTTRRGETTKQGTHKGQNNSVDTPPPATERSEKRNNEPNGAKSDKRQGRQRAHP